MISTNTISNVANFHGNKIQAEKKKETTLKMKDPLTTINKMKLNEEKLSDDAKKLLDNLRKKYGDFDFMVASKGDNKQAMFQVSRKEFSVIFSDEELEKMAQDESYAKEKLEIMEAAVEISRGIKQQYELLPNKGKQRINKVGISFNENGMMTMFVEVEKVSENEKSYLEKIKEKREEEKKEAKKETEKKAAEKEKEESIKKVIIEARNEEELMEKIQKIEWNKVVGEKVGARFDLMV